MDNFCPCLITGNKHFKDMLNNFMISIKSYLSSKSDIFDNDKIGHNLFHFTITLSFLCEQRILVEGLQHFLF